MPAITPKQNTTASKKKIDTVRKSDSKSSAGNMIVSEGNPVLRQKAENIPLADITSVKIKRVISNMKLALASQSDGVGLAAPQIAVPLRIFIVSKKIYGETATQDAVFINPTIVKYSKEKKWMEGEGCLSVRWVYGKVYRSTKVTIRAYDEQGKLFERGASALLAHIFQHEIDHLDGILFIDKAKDLEESDPADRENKKNNTPS